MSTRKTNVPAIPEVAGTAEAIDRTLRALKEATEVGYGRRGDPLDRFVTLRELRDAGVASVSTVSGGGAVIVTTGDGDGTQPGAPLPGDDLGPPDFGENDYTAPPQPKNVQAQGMPPELTNELEVTTNSRGIVMVTWDQPGYHNHYYAEIYRVKHNNSSAGPVHGLAENGLNLHYAHGAKLPNGAVNRLRADSPTKFVGVAAGTIFMDRDVPEIVYPGQDEMAQALNPGTYCYWVRFVSTAMVPGPLSDRADGKLALNTARVLDAMTRNVTNTAIFRNLREWLALGSDRAGRGGSILQYVEEAIEGSGIRTMWSVRMQHETSSGLVYSSGFGMSMETDDDTGKSISAFIINANQFAVMGNQGGIGGARIRSMSGGGASITLTLSTAGHRFREGMEAIISGPDGKVKDEHGNTFPRTSNPFPQLSGIDGIITGVSGATVTMRRKDDLSWPPVPPEFGHGSNQGHIQNMNAALLPAASVPFMVDTRENTVGIRGQLIVHGLVQADRGVFSRLNATSAFVDHMRAQTVNANVVVGQRIIAGTPGEGAIQESEINNISNYIVQLNNPVVDSYPLRIWKPTANHNTFYVDNQGNMGVGGNLSVYGSGVIAGGANNPDEVIFSTGGSGGDTGTHSRYALWIGKKTHYGTHGENRRMDNALFYVRSDNRAGFNTDLFLGGDPLALPSGNGYIHVKPDQNGNGSRVFCSATLSFIGQGESANCVIGVRLYLVPHWYTGVGPGNSGRGPLAYTPNREQFVEMHGEMGDVGPPHPSQYEVASLQVDSRNGAQDVKSCTLQGSAENVPGGHYKVFAVCWVKRSINGSGPHECYAIHPFAVQVSNK